MDESPMFRVRADDIATQDLGDEVVVLDLRSSSYLLLNPSGAVLWPALAEPVSIASLAGVLTDRFDVDEDQATTDASAFVHELLGLGLIERSDT
jgi:hypothetical protein